MSALSALFNTRATRVWVKGGGTLSNSAVPSSGNVFGVQRALGVVGAASVTLTLEAPVITGSVDTQYSKNGAPFVTFTGGETIAWSDGDLIQFLGASMVAGESYSVSVTYSANGLSGIQACACTLTAV